jgi:hypothetical protein
MENELLYPETGIYLRVKRDDKMRNVLIEDLTKEELTELFFNKDENGNFKYDNLENWIYPILELSQKVKSIIKGQI